MFHACEHIANQQQVKNLISYKYMPKVLFKFSGK